MYPRLAALAASLVLIFSVPASAQRSFQDRVSERPDGFDTPRNPSWRTTLSGVVHDMGDQPVGQAHVELRDVTTGALVTSTYTRPDGFFELRNTLPGEYELVATSGILETRQRVTPMETDYTLRLPQRLADHSGPKTISVAEMKVPKKARHQLQDAEENLNKDKLAEARKDLLKAIEIYPAYARAHMLLGVIEMQEGNPQAASALLEKAIQQDPDSATAYLALSASYNSVGRYADALRAVQSSTRLAPPSWQAYFETARANVGQGNFKDALQQVDRARQLCDRKFPSLYLVKAYALVGLKDYAAAANEFQQYLSNVPQGPEATQVRRALAQVKAFTAGAK